MTTTELIRKVALNLNGAYKLAAASGETVPIELVEENIKYVVAIACKEQRKLGFDEGTFAAVGYQSSNKKTN